MRESFLPSLVVGAEAASPGTSGSLGGAFAQSNDTEVNHTRLRDTEEPVWVALESAAVPFALLRAVRDASQAIVDFEWLYLNRAATKVHARPVGELIGRRIDAVYPGRWKAASEVFALYVRVIETGVADEIEHRFAHDTMRGWYHVVAAKCGDGVSVWFADVTGRREAWQDALVARRQLEAITDLMDAGVTRCSADLRYEWVSPRYASWLGRTVQDTTGRSIREVLGEVAFDALLPHFERVLSGKRVEYEAEAEFANLGRRWIRAAYVPSRGEHGAVEGWVAVVTDITERKRMELSLVAADRRKDEFLGVLAHELRNPLAAITNATHLIQEPRVGEQDRRRAAAMLARQAAHLSRLVDDLLDVARINRGQIVLKKEALPIGVVVEQAIETVRSIIQSKKQKLVTNLPKTEVRIDGDETRVAQIIGNLLHNAAKFSPPGSRITLTVMLEQGWVVLRVKDEGIGILPQDLPNVFELLHQGRQGIEREQGGLGIGLTVVRNLVVLHGGSVEAHSEGQGSGSEFVVRLPAASSWAEPRQVAQVTPSANARNVLVVDDNEDSAESLAVLLRLEGHQVTTAPDGIAALKKAADLHPDLVVLDIGLPGLDGYTVAVKLRERFGRESLQLIALTGYGREEDRAKALAAGFDAHLTKPIQPNQLLELLRPGGKRT